jgi:hypothetical protein
MLPAADAEGRPAGVDALKPPRLTTTSDRLSAAIMPVEHRVRATVAIADARRQESTPPWTKRTVNSRQPRRRTTCRSAAASRGRRPMFGAAVRARMTADSLDESTTSRGGGMCSRKQAVEGVDDSRKRARPGGTGDRHRRRSPRYSEDLDSESSHRKRVSQRRSAGTGP